MTDKQRQPPAQKPIRRERRVAERDAQRRPGSRGAPRPAWQSPMVLLSGAAAVVAVGIIAFAMLSTGQISTAGVKAPTDPMPPSAWDGRGAGRADAPATLVVYSDFQCPACDTFSTTTEPALVKDYVSTGELRIVYKDFSFLGQESLDAAVAARCAGDQGLFWPFHDYLFANQKGENRGAFKRDRLIAFGEVVGVDRATFQACLDSQAPLDAVKAETDEGRGLGVDSTPTLFLNGEKIVGVPAYGDLAARIEALIGGGSLGPSPSPSEAP